MKRRHRILIGLASGLLLGLLLLVVLRRPPDPPRALVPPRPGPDSAWRPIDVHTHIAPGDLDAALALFERSGVTAIVNLSGGVPGRGLEAQLAAAARHPGKVAVMCNLDFRTFGQPGWVQAQVKNLERAKALGAAGLKISKALGLAVRYPGENGRLLPVDDPILDPIFEAAGALALPVAIHTGDPRAFFEPPGPHNERHQELALNPSWSFHGKDFPTWRALRAAFLTRVRRHPQTIFIGVHFGNSPEDPAWLLDALDHTPNLYVDIAARLPEILREDIPGRFERTHRVFERHPDRILFGTDTMVVNHTLVLGAPAETPATAADAAHFFEAHRRLLQTDNRQQPSPSPIQGQQTVRGLALSRAQLQAITRDNPLRLFPQLAPRPPERRAQR